MTEGCDEDTKTGAVADRYPSRPWSGLVKEEKADALAKFVNRGALMSAPKNLPSLVVEYCPKYRIDDLRDRESENTPIGLEPSRVTLAEFSLGMPSNL